MKNVVFIPNIDLGNGRNSSYDYSIQSWKNFCDKNDCELIVWEDLIYPVDYMKITWQRYYLFDILDSNDINYNQVLMVDADTVVHPNCPNFFEETDNKYCGVLNDGDFEWVLRSIKGFGEEKSKYPSLPFSKPLMNLYLSTSGFALDEKRVVIFSPC